MKTPLALLVAVAAFVPAHAQIFRSSFDGVVTGAVAGAIIGNNSGSHNGARGAAIGAAAGLLLSGNGPSRVEVGFGRPYAAGRSTVGYFGRPYYPGRSASSWSRGYGYRGPIFLGDYGYGYGYDGYGYGDYGYSTGYDYDYGSELRPDYRSSGLFLGALAGAIIGHNSGGHNTWRGAAWGAGAGYLLGSVAESDARRIAVARQVRAQPVEAPAPTAQPVTIINNYYNTPASAMSAANGMFGR